MKELHQYNLTELSYQESATINGGGPFWEDFGKSIGMLVGWAKNAGEWVIDSIKTTPPGYDMSRMNQLMLFQ